MPRPARANMRHGGPVLSLPARRKPMPTRRNPATIIGGPVSPYVRKVLAACEIKGVPYRLDPIVPFFGDDRFSEISPLRRIPVLIDEEVTLCDSSVICQYLDEKYPSPPL